MAKDPSYQEMVEAYEYGLYTDKAKLAKVQRENGEPLNLDFQEKFDGPSVKK